MDVPSVGKLDLSNKKTWTKQEQLAAQVLALKSRSSDSDEIKQKLIELISNSSTIFNGVLGSTLVTYLFAKNKALVIMQMMQFVQRIERSTPKTKTTRTKEQYATLAQDYYNEHCKEFQD